MGPQLGPHDSFCQIYRGREVVRFRVTVSYWLLFIVASVASLHILFSEPAYLDSAWRWYHSFCLPTQGVRMWCTQFPSESNECWKTHLRKHPSMCCPEYAPLTGSRYRHDYQGSVYHPAETAYVPSLPVDPVAIPSSEWIPSDYGSPDCSRLFFTEFTRTVAFVVPAQSLKLIENAAFKHIHFTAMQLLKGGTNILFIYSG